MAGPQGTSPLVPGGLQGRLCSVLVLPGDHSYPHMTRVAPISPRTRVTRPDPRCPVVRVHSNRGLRVSFCRMKTKPGALEAGAAPASFGSGFVFVRQKLTRSPPFEWTRTTGHPGGHQTAVGGFKWAPWCAASPLGRSEEFRGTGGSRVGVWGRSLVSMTAIPISTTEAGFGRPWRCLA